MRRTITLFFIACFAFALQVSAQIEGYYRINNVSGFDGQSYLNVNTNIINPAMTFSEAVSDASSVFHLKTSENIATGRNAKPIYRVESLTSQDANSLKFIADMKYALSLVPEAGFNLLKQIIKNGLESNETIKEQVDALNERYQLSLDDFTYEQYVEWVNSFDTDLYMLRNSGSGNNAKYQLYINFPNLPDAFRKEVEEKILFVTIKHNSQDDINTAMIIIGPLLKEAIIRGIEETPLVSSVINRDNLPGLFMMLDVLERIQFGKKLYIIEDDEEPKLSFARENGSILSVIDPGTILWAGDKGLWTLEAIDEAKPFRLQFDESLSTSDNNYVTTFYSEFPFELADDMKAYVVDRDFVSTGSILSRKYYCIGSQIAGQGEVVPAHTPVIVATASLEDNRIIPVLSDLTPVDNNRLAGSVEEVNLLLVNKADKRMLTTSGKYVVFAIPGLGVSSLPKNTAFFDFSVLELINPTTIYLTFDDPTTGIDAITAGQPDAVESSEAYNLSGRRVQKTEKGLHIFNGKKVVVK